MQVSEKAKRFRQAVGSNFFMRDWERVPDIAKKLKAQKIARKSITPELIREAQRWDDSETRRLLDWVAERNARIIAKQNPPKPEAPKPAGRVESPKPESGKRQEIFGFPMTAVLRWMGREGWTIHQALHVLTALDVSCSVDTIRAQVRAGKTGQRGAPAELSIKQELELNRMVPEE